MVYSNSCKLLGKYKSRLRIIVFVHHVHTFSMKEYTLYPFMGFNEPHGFIKAQFYLLKLTSNLSTTDI